MGREDSMRTLIRFWTDEDGSTAVEYALLSAMIACIFLAAMASMGNVISSKYQNIADSVSSATSGS
jgi:Flp pilus assembly pilin Flp